MSLKDNIVKSKPRENSGPTTGNRFDYQKDWALCKLLDYHNSHNDYLFVFDYHDDLMIMDSEANPQKVSFYQIKGDRSKKWTLTRLLEAKKDKDNNPLLSIIGKLFHNKLVCDKETESLNFVSNALFKIPLESKQSSESKNSICIVELTAADRQKIKERLVAEHNLPCDPEFEDFTFLKVVELNLDDSPTYTQGKVASFLETIRPGGRFDVPAIYKTLFHEVKRRAGYNKEILSYEDLIKHKAIGKAYFEEIISNCGVHVDYEELWKVVENSLISEGVVFGKRNEYKSIWTRFQLEKMNPNNDLLREIIRKVSAAQSKVLSNGISTMTLMNTVSEIYSEYQTAPITQVMYDKIYIETIILMKLHE